MANKSVSSHVRLKMPDHKTRIHRTSNYEDENREKSRSIKKQLKSLLTSRGYIEGCILNENPINFLK